MMTTAVPFFAARFLEQPGPWVDDAACAGQPVDRFFPEIYQKVEVAALACCRACPVRRACLEHALRNNELHGIWGGYTSRQRARIRKRLRHRQRQVAAARTAA